ncbi:hypothetical protein ALC57_10926, partial [Trachymyrmex cornetzi]
LCRGIPPPALTATLASISETTLAQYSKSIRLWLFCQKKEVSCFAPSALNSGIFVFFLGRRRLLCHFEYRSAVSLISQNEIGSHSLVRRFFKGIVNIIFSDSLIIRIPARLKTSGIGRCQPLLSFKPFTDKPELCVFSLVKFYLSITGDLRQTDCNSLFISFRAPYKVVSFQTLGRWVKTKIHTAGVDRNIFSTHSIRHASTSLAANEGISLEEIRCTAGWSKSSETFARFYNRPILSNTSFQGMILDIS